MKAAVLHEIAKPLGIEDRPDPSAGSGLIVVDLKAAGLNRRDYWITQGMYPGIQFPAVLGSDGAGIVSEVGDGVDESWLEQQVIINPGLNWGNWIRLD